MREALCFPICALNRPTWSPVKAAPLAFPPIGSATVVRQRFFWMPATDTDIISAQHFWTGGLETAEPGCYDAVAIAWAAAFRMLVMSRIRHAAINLLSRTGDARRLAITVAQ
jgi:hypothetical protein